MLLKDDFSFFTKTENPVGEYIYKGNILFFLQLNDERKGEMKRYDES